MDPFFIRRNLLLQPLLFSQHVRRLLCEKLSVCLLQTRMYGLAERLMMTQM